MKNVRDWVAGLFQPSRKVEIITYPEISKNKNSSLTGAALHSPAPFNRLGGGWNNWVIKKEGRGFKSVIIDPCTCLPNNNNTKLLLSGKTQNRIKSLSALLYNQGFGLFMIKASPPLMKKHRFWGCFLNISCNNIIPCFVWILHKRDKVDVVHECEANHCDHLWECTFPFYTSWKDCYQQIGD